MPRQKIAPRDYFDLLDLIHQTVVPRTYVEIGVATGKSLSLTLPGTFVVGIDPAADIRHPVSGELHIFRDTSDEFFANAQAKELFNGRSIELAFIDGLHLSEAVLRDFRNLEARSQADSVILIHDCIPPNVGTASRQRSTKIWVGDVWKAIVALRRHRPELDIKVVDVPPTGLAIVTGLKPSSRILFDHYDLVVADLDRIPAPIGDIDWRRLVGAVSFDWSIIRNHLPNRGHEAASIRKLVAQRSRRLPTRAHVAWQLRRYLSHSRIGRLLRDSPESAAWTGRGA